MLLIKATARFLKDLKHAQKRGYNIDKLEAIVDLLQAQKPLPPRNVDPTCQTAQCGSPEAIDALAF
ncbi:MAG: hypothetical protein NTAFB01_07130 [Nitrospira sp.]